MHEFRVNYSNARFRMGRLRESFLNASLAGTRPGAVPASGFGLEAAQRRPAGRNRRARKNSDQRVDRKPLSGIFTTNN
jgi:hypothetical protein